MSALPPVNELNVAIPKPHTPFRETSVGKAFGWTWNHIVPSAGAAATIFIARYAIAKCVDALPRMARQTPDSAIEFSMLAGAGGAVTSVLAYGAIWRVWPKTADEGYRAIMGRVAVETAPVLPLAIGVGMLAALEGHLIGQNQLLGILEAKQASLI
jgi:hypothetical protein